MSIKKTIALHRQWWTRTNTRPLVGLFAPHPCPCPGNDMHVDPGGIVRCKTENVRAAAVVPGDRLPTARVDFGTAFVPALAGAGFELSGGTTWARPCATGIEDLVIRPFDPDLPLWREYWQRFVPLVEGWSWDTYLPSTTIMVGPLDILAAMLGPEALSIELYANPEGVREKALEAARLFIDVFDAQRDVIRAAGLENGMADWMGVWMPGDGLCYSEDFSALCGATHFRDFFIPANRTITAHLDTAFLHTHSASLACIPAMMELDLDAQEISNDPSGPPLEQIIAAARQLQSIGRRVQISNWERDLSDNQVADIMRHMDPRGFRVTFQARSLEQAHHLLQLAHEASQETA